MNKTITPVQKQTKTLRIHVHKVLYQSFIWGKQWEEIVIRIYLTSIIIFPRSVITGPSFLRADRISGTVTFTGNTVSKLYNSLFPPSPKKKYTKIFIQTRIKSMKMPSGTDNRKLEQTIRSLQLPNVIKEGTNKQP